MKIDFVLLREAVDSNELVWVGNLVERRLKRPGKRRQVIFNTIMMQASVPSVRTSSETKIDTGSRLLPSLNTNSDYSPYTVYCGERGGDIMFLDHQLAGYRR
jgi:hypothetical protein